MSFHTIVLATDFSPAVREAEKLAGELARPASATLHLVHVLPLLFSLGEERGRGGRPPGALPRSDCARVHGGRCDGDAEGGRRPDRGGNARLPSLRGLRRRDGGSDLRDVPGPHSGRGARAEARRGAERAPGLARLELALPGPAIRIDGQAVVDTPDALDSTREAFEGLALGC